MDLRSAAVAGAALACTVLGGCGGGEEAVQPFEPRTHQLDWHEVLEHEGERVFEFAVTQLRYDGRSWHVHASFENASAVAFAVEPPRGLPPGADPRWTWLGVTTSTSAAPPRAPRILHAETYDPPLPARLDPGERWVGVFSGPGSPQPGMYLRVTFGTFRPLEPFAPELTPFRWVTDHVLKL